MLQIFTSILVFLHPFFVSVTDIKQNHKNKTIEISSKIFFDDFEKSLESKYKQKIDIIKPSDKMKVDAFIADYMSKHLLLNINGKSVQFRYLGYEIEQEAVWCYMEVAKVDKIKTLGIKNDILFDEHESQVNMLHVTIDGKRQSTKLDNPESRATFRF